MAAPEAAATAAKVIARIVFFILTLHSPGLAPWSVGDGRRAN